MTLQATQRTDTGGIPRLFNRSIGRLSILVAALVLAGCQGAGSGGKPPITSPPAQPSGMAKAPPAMAAPRPGLDWPSFRGLAASGISDGRPLPETFSGSKPQNLLWKTAIPGLAHSSPVIWGDRLYVTSAVPVSGAAAPLKVGLYGEIAPVPDEGVHRFNLYALDRKSGRILWERTAFEGTPKIKRHTKASHANSTPATDGKHVAAFFGTEGLYLYDAEGKLLWKKDLGTLDAGYYLIPQAQWGFGSSPILHEDRVIVQCDVQGGGFLAAFRIADGSEIWRTARQDVPTWSTPTVVMVNGKAQVVVNGLKEIGGYDVATGQRIWTMQGGGDIPVPTPIAGLDLIFITNAHGGGAPVYAIRQGATGELATAEGSPTRAQFAWLMERGGAYMQTPILYGERLYLCRDNGELKVYDAKSGQELHKQRLGGGTTGFTASGVAGDGKLYYTSENGDVYVLTATAAPELRSTNELGETAMASPAIADGTLYFRGRNHLFAFAAPAAGGAAGGAASAGR